MSKDELRKAAEQLIEAERLCRNAYAEEGYEEAHDAVKCLTERVRDIHLNIPELAGKQYWWDTPFSPEKPEDAGFCFDEGEYSECEQIRIKTEQGKCVIYQKSKNMDYDSLSLEMTLGTYVTLFLNKKQLRNHLNDPMRCRYIYNTSVLCYEASTVPDLTRGKEGSADVWKQYQEIEAGKRADFQEYLKSHNETWDTAEKIAHGSLFTNEERWFMGKMDTDDYLNESLFRDSFAMDKESKMNEDLYRMRLQATQFSQEVRKRQIEQRRNSLSMANSKNRVRIMPVGHIVYCGDEIMAIFLHKEKETVVEFECTGDVDLTAFEGQSFESRVLYEKKPAWYPVVRSLAREYNDVLPELSVLAVRPPNCPEEIWREWIAARWEQKICK